MKKRIGFYNWANDFLSKRVLFFFLSGFIAISGINGQGRPNELLKYIRDARNEGNDEMLAKNLNTLAFVYLQSNLDSADLMLKQAMNIAHEKNIRMEYIRANIFTGYAKISRGNFTDAYDNLKIAREKLKEGDDKQTFASCYTGLGIVAVRLNEFTEAITYFQKTYEILKELGQEQQAISALANIGAIHVTQRNYEKAHEYYMKAHEYWQKADDKTQFQNFHGMIAFVLREMKEYKKSVSFAMAGLKIAKQTGNVSDIINISGTLGNTYFLTKEYDSAIYYLDIAVAQAEKSNRKQTLVLNLSYLSRCYAEKRDYKKALLYANLANENGNINDINKQINIAEAYVSVYENRGDYKNALKYFKNKANMIDSIYTEEQKQEIARLETRFNLKLKVQQIEILNKENEVQKQKMRMQLFGMTFLAIIIILITLLYIRVSRANKALNSKNLELMKSDAKKAELNQLLKQYSNAKKDDILEGIEILINDKRIYRQPKISLDECARLLDVNRTYLSRVLNDHYQCNFNTFINHNRIVEARKLLINPVKQNFTIEAIGNEVGFTSKSVFNSVFKKETGITPSYFKNTNN